MRRPTYIYRRPDTGSFLFRWVVPAFLRPALGGKREIRQTLDTRDRRQALVAARQLSVASDRGAMLVAKQGTADTRFVMHCILTCIENFVSDGSLLSRTRTVQIDPDKLEQEEKAAQIAMRVLESNQTPAERTEAGQTLVELIAAYFAERTRTKPLTPKTRQEVESSLSLMCEVSGEDRRVSELTRADFRRLKEVPQKLPKNKTKDAQYRDKTTLELASSSIAESDLLTPCTLTRIWDRVSTLFKWATFNGHVKENDAEGMRFAEPTRKRSHPKRESYTDAQASKVLDFLLSGDYDAKNKPWRKWGPSGRLLHGVSPQ